MEGKVNCMYNKFSNKELVKYLKNIVNNEAERVGDYYQVLDPNSDKPYVIHNKTYQITAILRGIGIAVVNDDIIELKENDILIMDKNTKHSFVCSDSELELFHIHLPKDEIDTDRFILRDNCMENSVEKGV